MDEPAPYPTPCTSKSEAPTSVASKTDSVSSADTVPFDPEESRRQAAWAEIDRCENFERDEVSVDFDLLR